MVCVRTAWLVLGSSTLPLENEAAGYFCTSLDLGFPTVRAVTDDNPDMDGATDRTRLMGARTVNVNVTALAGAGAQVDAVASQFGPYMIPSVRPELHYILDRPGNPERMLTLRPANYGWPVTGDNQRDIALQWVAPDPVARNPVAQTETTWAGSAGGSGRQYNLNPPRSYPAGGGAASTAVLSTPGDVGARPVFTIYGPVTAPALTFTQQSAPGTVTTFAFLPSFSLSAGQTVIIDSQRRTVTRGGQSVLNLVNWPTSTWPYVPPQPQSVLMALTGSSTSGNTQAVATWNDGYLT